MTYRKDEMMKKILFACFLCFMLTPHCEAQTHTRNLMPDGSYDAYFGLGASYRPAYEGSKQMKLSLVPAFQMQWGNGAYISGMSAGWHLSDQVNHEFGPLIQIEPRRTNSGTSNGIETPTNNWDQSLGFGDPSHTTSSGNTNTGNIGTGNDVNIGNGKVQNSIRRNKLIGMNELKARLLAGGFYHYTLNDQWRSTNVLMYGAGHQRDGILFTSDLIYRIRNGNPHLSINLSAGINVVNRAYANSYFGVDESEGLRSHNPLFDAKAGVKDIHMNLSLHQQLNASWSIKTNFRVNQLLRNVKDSPLVEQNTSFSIYSLLAYRF